MKKTTLAIIASMLFPCLLYADPEPAGFKDWMPKLKEFFGEEKPNVPEISSAEAREMKYPGQRFQHIAKTDIVSKGKSTKQSKYWFDRTVEYNFGHETSFILLEEILDVGEDEEEGAVIKSKFTVQVFNERLKAANANVTFGFVSSKDLFRLIRQFGEAYKGQIDNAARNLVAVGIIALGTPEPTVSKIVAIGSLATGGALKLASWFAFEKLSELTDEDDNIILSDETVHKYFPECFKVIAKMHKLEGTEILTTWVSGKGYTEFYVKNRLDLSDEDEEWIAKNVYRFNPVGVNSVLPKNKKGKDNVWYINVHDVFGGILQTTGIAFDTILGQIKIKDCGMSQQHFDDEEYISGQEKTDVSTLMTVDGNNDITFVKNRNNKRIEVNAQPKEGTIVVVDPNAKQGHKGPRYVKSVELRGDFTSHIDNPTGLLESINFEENTIKLYFVYCQLRIPSTN